LNEVILDEVRVLKLIDHHIAAELLIGPQDLWIAPEQNRYKEEEISKIEGIVTSKILLIALID
jgi:hypothetical protein